jgi:hypothetical protein
MDAYVLNAAALADTAVLTNGDRLTGRIEDLDGGRLVLATSYAGTVRIDLTAIAELRSDDGFLGQAQLNADWEGDPAPGRESTDRMLIFSLGYRW